MPPAFPSVTPSSLDVKIYCDFPLIIALSSIELHNDLIMCKLEWHRAQSYVSCSLCLFFCPWILFFFQQVLFFFSLFNRTRDIAVGPLRAAEAYKRIVDALLSAEEAARNASAAAEKAYTVVSQWALCARFERNSTVYVISFWGPGEQEEIYRMQV